MDVLAKKILDNFKIPDRGKTRPSLTALPLALRYYLQSQESEIKFMMKEETAEFYKGVDHLKKAIQENPNFATANWGLGDLYENRFVNTNKKEDFDRAYELELNNPQINFNVDSFLRSIGLDEKTGCGG